MDRVRLPQPGVERCEGSVALRWERSWVTVWELYQALLLVMIGIPIYAFLAAFHSRQIVSFSNALREG